MMFDQETIDRAIELWNSLLEVVKKIVEIVKEIFNNICDFVREIVKKKYPKLYHLAVHHKSERVRKKNRSRLLRLFKRFIQYK